MLLRRIENYVYVAALNKYITRILFIIWIQCQPNKMQHAT